MSNGIIISLSFGYTKLLFFFHDYFLTKNTRWARFFSAQWHKTENKQLIELLTSLSHLHPHSLIPFVSHCVIHSSWPRVQSSAQSKPAQGKQCGWAVERESVAIAINDLKLLGHLLISSLILHEFNHLLRIARWPLALCSAHLLAPLFDPSLLRRKHTNYTVHSTHYTLLITQYT